MSPATPAAWKRRIDGGGIDVTLEELYGTSRINAARQRLVGLLDEFVARFSPDRPVMIATAPGRTELGGNHTDHNRGRVLAGSVHLDSLAVVAAREDAVATIVSDGFDAPFRADLRSLEKVAAESGTTTALIRGVASGFAKHNLEFGGFDCCVQSDVLRGSGLSSSASIEVLIGTILSHLFNSGRATSVDIAHIGQYAENVYFGKPCGLMDQTACAHGGIVAIDFADPETPRISPVSFSFESAGYRLLVVDTGGNHADLTGEYAAIPEEMRKVAGALGGEVLRDVDSSSLSDNVTAIRNAAGDRAILRAMHFFRDNERVPAAVAALRDNDVRTYLRLVNESGDSSWMLLQNCFTMLRPGEQGITLAIALTREFLRSHGAEDGAARVHGGGFAGTVQAYIPLNLEREYQSYMQRIFGEGCVTPLSIRNVGATVMA